MQNVCGIGVGVIIDTLERQRLYREVEVVKSDVKKWVGEVSIEPLQAIGTLGN